LVKLRIITLLAFREGHDHLVYKLLKRIMFQRFLDQTWDNFPFDSCYYLGLFFSLELGLADFRSVLLKNVRIRCGI
jgi:hypothetical protein